MDGTDQHQWLRDHGLSDRAQRQWHVVDRRLVHVVDQFHEGRCTSAGAARVGPGSGHLLFAVGGINSATDPRTGRSFGLDTRAVLTERGYSAAEVDRLIASGVALTEIRKL